MDGLTRGQLAQRAQINLETVRFYEQEGLLAPASRTASGYRKFEESAVDRLEFVRRAKALGFSLGEIRDLLIIQGELMPALPALGLRRDPHGSVKQIHHAELEDGDKERPSAFPKIMLKQTDSGIQQLHGAGERTQDQQRRRGLLVDRPQCEQSQRNCARRRVHR